MREEATEIVFNFIFFFLLKMQKRNHFECGKLSEIAKKCLFKKLWLKYELIPGITNVRGNNNIFRCILFFLILKKFDQNGWYDPWIFGRAIKFKSKQFLVCVRIINMQQDSILKIRKLCIICSLFQYAKMYKKICLDFHFHWFFFFVADIVEHFLVLLENCCYKAFICYCILLSNVYHLIGRIA